MKSPTEVVQYIEHWYSLFLDRPEAYFGSAESMEDVLVVLEQLYEFVVDDEWKFPFCADFRYHEFLEREGFGSARFTTRNPGSIPAVAAFWRKYLTSGMRKHPSGDSKRTGSP